MVKKIYETKPERKYIFAIDNNKKPTQKKLITAISNGIGTGLVESIDIPESFKMAHPKMTPIQLDLDWKKSLLLDLFVTPSSLFVKEEVAGGGGEDGEEGGGEVLELNWHCKSGMAENIQLVKDEFAKERKLKPVKIFITGPPCSGKSFFGKQMADHYNVPHISIGSLLEEIQTWDQEKEDKWKKLEDDRDVKIKEIEMHRELVKAEKAKAREDAKKVAEKVEDDEEKPEGDAEEGEEKAPDPADAKPDTPEQPIVVQIDGDSDDEFLTIEIKEKVIAYIKKNGKDQRIPNDIINEAVRWRLERNDCQNRGYVLDGYPKNFGNAESVFVVTPKRPEKKLNEEGEEENPPDEEELAKLLKPKLQAHIYPESVITLHGSDQFLKRRSKEL